MQLFASLREGSDGHNQAGAAVKLISIHAPVKGATRRLPSLSVTTPISIHAPVKEATCDRLRTKSCEPYFNPRSREGSDFGAVSTTREPDRFQSTLPRVLRTRP